MRTLIRLLLGVAGAGLLLGGDLTDRYHLTLNRVLSGGPPAYSPDMVLADVVPQPGRRFTEYSGDVSGRYLSALALSELEAGKPFDALHAIVPRILGLQKKQGYFGAAFNESSIGASEMAVLWGNGRLLVGLLDEYRLQRRPEVLDAARRIGDFLVRIAPVMNDDTLRKRIDAEEFASGYICWTHNIEGLAELYRVTRDGRFLDLAVQIAGRTKRYPKQHSHGFLSSVRGIVDLYRLTGNGKYLDTAEREWQGVIDSGNVAVQGAVPEAFAPDIKRTEGCSEADWLRLSLALWQLTGKPVYLDGAERTLFNEYAMNQFQTGDFGHRVLGSTGVPAGSGPDGLGTARAWWCCTLHGLRGFADVFASVFRSKDGALWFDLPVDGRGKTGGFAVRSTSELGKTGAVTLAVTASDGAAHSLFVRQPGWASRIDVSLNGAGIKADAREGYLEIRRQWAAGDTVALAYSMRTHTVRDSKTGRVALFHGPWLLGADEEANPYFRDEPHTDNRLLLAPGADGSLKLEPAPAGRAGSLYPVAHFRVKYLPGGYPMQPAEAELQPVAEQTGMRTVAWDFWFRLTGK